MKILKYEPQGGRRLEDAYGVWLNLFKEVAEASNEAVEVHGAPESWSLLLWYLGAPTFYDNNLADGSGREGTWRPTRAEVEASCAKEAVLVDALWRADMVWKGGGPHSDLRRHTWELEFPVATYSAFWRPEVMQYIKQTLPAWKPTKKKCVLVPCAADKDYVNGPFHSKVREVVGDEYHIIVATGVLGLVPDDLWGKMPHYDSGIPYEARLTDTTTDVFTKHSWWNKIIVYSDFYANALYKGLGAAGLFAEYPLGSGRRTEYENLLDERWLNALRRCL